MKELSKAQIERQDFVDNVIFNMIQELNPVSKEIVWDMEMIGSIRDVISLSFQEKGICDEQEFYPYIEE